MLWELQFKLLSLGVYIVAYMNKAEEEFKHFFFIFYFEHFLVFSVTSSTAVGVIYSIPSKYMYLSNGIHVSFVVLWFIVLILEKSHISFGA